MRTPQVQLNLVPLPRETETSVTLAFAKVKHSISGLCKGQALNIANNAQELTGPSAQAIPTFD